MGMIKFLKNKEYAFVLHGVAGQNLISVEIVIVHTKTVNKLLSEIVSRPNITGMRTQTSGVQTRVFPVKVMK